MFSYLGLDDISTSTIVGGTFTAIAVLFIVFAHFVFLKWEQDFPANRVERTDDRCPSNKQAPGVTRCVTK